MMPAWRRIIRGLGTPCLGKTV